MSHDSRNLSDFTITHLMERQRDRDSLGQYVRNSHEDDNDNQDRDDDSDPGLLSGLWSQARVVLL